LVVYIEGETKTEGSGEKYIMRSLMIFTAYPIFFSGDQMEKNEMDGAFTKYGEDRDI
jgi:hypothetical protein